MAQENPLGITSHYSSSSIFINTITLRIDGKAQIGTDKEDKKTVLSCYMKLKII